VRSKRWFPGLLFLALALSVPAIIFSQQNRSARRQPGNPTDRSGAGASARNKPVVTPNVVKTDLNEALAVIQNNYIDGRKLDYKANGWVEELVVLGALASVLLLMLLALLSASSLMRLVGSRVEGVITRLLGVLLSALAVQYVIDGVRGVLALH